MSAGFVNYAEMNLPFTANFFWNREGWGSDNCSSRFICKKFQKQQTPCDDLTPTTLVLAPGDPIEPVGLRIVLLAIQNFRGDISGDMVGDIIAENEGDGLALHQVDMANHARSKHLRSGFLLESHRWA
jgi:hypothetical protein